MKNSTFLLLAGCLSVAGAWSFLADPRISKPTAAKSFSPRGKPIISLRQGLNVSQENSAPNDWKQVKIMDLPHYVQRLRKDGFSEATVERIVSSKISAVYDEKRLALTVAQFQLDPIRREQLLQKISEAEITQMTNLLGHAPAIKATRPNSDAPRASVSNQATKAVIPPAVLSPPVPSISLSETQAKNWQKAQDEFVAAVGGENQNPNDPDYLTRWQTAQEYSDNLFRAKYGTTAFMDQQREAFRQSHQGSSE